MTVHADVQRIVLVTTVLLLCGLIVRPTSAVTIDDLKLTPENCRVLRANVGLFGSVPCECRLSTGNVKPVQCYPNCCPRTPTFEGDRCHTENRLLWSPYEQLVCNPRPPAEYTDDTPNCFYKGNDPVIVSVDNTHKGETTFNFGLSVLPAHKCLNLYVARCNPERVDLYDFRLNTTRKDKPYCWLGCPPKPLAKCTEDSCWAHRGETPGVVKTWTMPRRLDHGDYALVCQSLMKHVAEGSVLYQDAFAQSYFRLNF